MSMAVIFNFCRFKGHDDPNMGDDFWMSKSLKGGGDF